MRGWRSSREAVWADRCSIVDGGDDCHLVWLQQRRRRSLVRQRSNGFREAGILRVPASFFIFASSCEKAELREKAEQGKAELRRCRSLRQSHSTAFGNTAAPPFFRSTTFEGTRGQGTGRGLRKVCVDFWDKYCKLA